MTINPVRTAKYIIGMRKLGYTVTQSLKNK